MGQEEEYDADEILREHDDVEPDEEETEEPVEELDFEKADAEPLDNLENEEESSDLLA